MTPPTRVTAIEIERLDLPLRAPFGISGGAQAAANNVLLRVTLGGGATGFGEAAPLPPYNGETQADALAQLGGAQGWVVGRDARAWREIGAEFAARAGARGGAARCALETALLDALTRHDGIPWWKFFGGASTGLETDMTITTGTVEQAAAAAKAIHARGIRTIKVKIGGPGGPARDGARIAAIHAADPSAPLILDGNAGLSRGDAGELVRELKQRRIAPALLEQWLAKDDLEGMRALGEESGWLVAADESVATPEDARRVVQARAAHVLNIKLMKAGIAVAQDIVEIGRAAGLRLMIGGNVESILAMTASACFAAGLGGFGYADLDTPLFLAENPFVGGYTMDGGRLSVAHIESGHGVEPR